MSFFVSAGGRARSNGVRPSGSRVAPVPNVFTVAHTCSNVCCSHYRVILPHFPCGSRTPHHAESRRVRGGGAAAGALVLALTGVVDLHHPHGRQLHSRSSCFSLSRLWLLT